VDKLQAACNITRAMVARYGAQLEAPWSQGLPVFEARLANAADYALVLVGPGRPAITDAELIALDTLADQVHGAMTATAGDLLVAIAGGVETRGERRNTAQLAEVAAAYRDDAARERRTSQACFLLFVLLILSSLGFILWGILRISARADLANNSISVWPVFSTHLVAAVVGLAAAVVVIIQAERHRRASQEAIRLARQFTAVESYLAPMPSALRDIVRVSLTPRLFSRILWDDDPIREPIWPTASDIAAARPSPRHRAPRSGSASDPGAR
jgi:hypothetical protein